MKKLIFIFTIISFSVTSCVQQKVAVSSVIDPYLDSDLDGVPDYKDACPLEYGSPFNLGCPKESDIPEGFNRALSTDADLDGIPDDEDECPYEYGSPFNMGCPIEE